MKYIITLIISGLAFFTAAAQTNYQPGYYISNGERVEGEILNQDWNKNPEDFSFRTSATAETVRKDISQVSEFGVADLKYERHEVEVALNSIFSVDDLTDQRTPDMEKRTIFLKVILEGSVSLYSYAENNIHKYFLSTPESGVQQLLYNKYKLSDTQVAENNYYQQQLYLYVNCDQPVSYFQRVDYTRQALEKHFIKYYECTGEEFNRLNNIEKRSTLHLIPKAGINYTTLKYTNARVTDVEFDPTISPVFGAELEYILPFNNNKWGLVFGIMYQQYKSEIATDVYANPLDPSTKLWYGVDYKSIGFAPGIRHYFFLGEKSALHLTLTYSFDKPMSSTIDSEFNTNEITAGSANVNIGAGALLADRVFLQVNYGLNKDIFRNYVFMKSEFQSIMVLGGIRLF